MNPTNTLSDTGDKTSSNPASTSSINNTLMCCKKQDIKNQKAHKKRCCEKQQVGDGDEELRDEESKACKIEMWAKT
jgi:hypothetical protein